MSKPFHVKHSVMTASLASFQMEDYNLSWQWHSQETLKSFEVLRKSETHTDAVLYCENDVIRAHKVILAACSAYFHRALAQIHETSRYTVILLPKINANLLRLALDFMYLGKVTVPSDKLESFMELSAFLEIRGLEGLAVKTAAEKAKRCEAAGKPVSVDAVPVPVSSLSAMIPTSAGSSLVPIVVPSFTVFKASGNVVKTEHRENEEGDMQSIVSDQFAESDSAGAAEASTDCEMGDGFNEDSGTNGDSKPAVLAAAVEDGTSMSEDICRGSQDYPAQIPAVIVQSAMMGEKVQSDNRTFVAVIHGVVALQKIYPFYENGDFCDVTLVCNGVCFDVHAVLLAAQSRYFYELFRKNPCKRVFQLTELSPEHLQKTLEFFYRGRVEVPCAAVPGFVFTLNKLEVTSMRLNAEDTEALKMEAERFIKATDDLRKPVIQKGRPRGRPSGRGVSRRSQHRSMNRSVHKSSKKKNESEMAADGGVVPPARIGYIEDHTPGVAEATDKPREPTDKPREPTDKPREPTDKPREPTEEAKTPLEPMETEKPQKVMENEYEDVYAFPNEETMIEGDSEPVQETSETVEEEFVEGETCDMAADIVETLALPEPKIRECFVKLKRLAFDEIPAEIKELEPTKKRRVSDKSEPGPEVPVPDLVTQDAVQVEEEKLPVPEEFAERCIEATPTPLLPTTSAPVATVTPPLKTITAPLTTITTPVTTTTTPVPAITIPAVKIVTPAPKITTPAPKITTPEPIVPTMSTPPAMEIMVTTASVPSIIPSIPMIPTVTAPIATPVAQTVAVKRDKIKTDTGVTPIPQIVPQKREKTLTATYMTPVAPAVPAKRENRKMLKREFRHSGHAEALGKDLWGLRDLNVTTDSQLMSGTECFPVHSCVLACNSPYFENFFRTQKTPNPVFVLPKADPKAVMQLLEFMYTGETEVEMEQLTEFGGLANLLDVPVLKELWARGKIDDARARGSGEKINMPSSPLPKNRARGGPKSKRKSGTSAPKKKARPESSENQEESTANTSPDTTNATMNDSPATGTILEVDGLMVNIPLQYDVTTVQRVNWCLVSSEHLESRKKFFFCSICSQQFGRKASAEIHMREHVASFEYCCPECVWGVNSVDELRLHVSEKHAEDEMMFAREEALLAEEPFGVCTEQNEENMTYFDMTEQEQSQINASTTDDTHAVMIDVTPEGVIIDDPAKLNDAKKSPRKE
ncbi:unnamed protein product [Notodromas monacha]|uniref:BTB domain-containing protein n=1 Tax=Notodromas monacha TaxID=399045 RepID=A0A7R9BC67_9CRUS|nr:unnamed protein product [Notodromas monacha]CAG0912597.1 unnamed protein product [Notodromas monacha]